MTARSPSAFMLSAALHAVIVALLLLIGYASSRSAKDADKIFHLVAGEGDNYAAKAAPALGTPGGAKIERATPPEQPKAQPVKQTAPKSSLATQLRRSVIKAESKAKQQVAKERAAEEKRLADEKKKQDLQAKTEAAAQNKAKTSPTNSKSPPKVAKRIDTEGIVAGVIGGSTENTKGGAGGKALATDSANVVDAYFAMFKQRVRDNFEAPTGLSDSLRGEFEFRIHADGSISNARVLKSSGSSEFDRAVLAAIRQVKMPAHPYSRTETVEFQFMMRERDTG